MQKPKRKSKKLNVKIPESKPDDAQIQSETKGILHSVSGMPADFMESKGVKVLKQSRGRKFDEKGS